MKRSSGNLGRAAFSLGIHRNTLRNKVGILNIRLPRDNSASRFPPTSPRKSDYRARRVDAPPVILSAAKDLSMRQSKGPLVLNPGAHAKRAFEQKPERGVAATGLCARRGVPPLSDGPSP